MITARSLVEKYGALGLAGALFVVTFVVVVIDPAWLDTPRVADLVLLTASASALVGWMPAQRLVEWIYSPDVVHLLVVKDDPETVMLWEMTPQEFDELDVDSGTSLYQWDGNRSLYEADEYRPDEQTVRGSWRGSATTLQLLSHREKVGEVRGRLEDMARRGLALRIRLTSIVRAATTDAVVDVLETLEASPAVMPSEDVVRESVEDAMPEDLRRSLEDGKSDGTDPDDSRDLGADEESDEDSSDEAEEGVEDTVETEVVDD